MSQSRDYLEQKVEGLRGAVKGCHDELATTKADLDSVWQTLDRVGAAVDAALLALRGLAEVQEARIARLEDEVRELGRRDDAEEGAE